VTAYLGCDHLNVPPRAGDGAMLRRLGPDERLEIGLEPAAGQVIRLE
jgi:hypothetical protein